MPFYGLCRYERTYAMLCVMTTTNTSCDRFYYLHSWILTHWHATLRLGCNRENCRSIVNMVIRPSSIAGPVEIYDANLIITLYVDVQANGGGGARSATTTVLAAKLFFYSERFLWLPDTSNIVIDPMTSFKTADNASQTTVTLWMK